LSVEHHLNAADAAPVPGERISEELASATRRFWTFVVDQIVIWIGLFALQIAYGVAFGLEALQALDGIKWWGIFLAFYVLYFVSFEVISGRTPGKVLTGTRVVTNDGRALSIPTALIRSLCRMIPFEPMSFSLGETWWHDSLSRTQVVRLRRAS
jgi:uncharacterized RDD family membrane protein YckC